MAGERDLGYALRLLAGGQTVEQIWKEAGFSSRKDLADSLFELAGKADGSCLKLVAYADGASIGNPGDAGCGASGTKSAVLTRKEPTAVSVEAP